MAGKPYTKDEQVASVRKPYRRVVASAKGWAKLRDERHGPCLVCRYTGIPTGDPVVELHHVVSRGRGGDDVAVNLVSLCRPHHQRVTDGVSVTLQALAAAVQAWEPAVYVYAVEKMGEDGWLRAHKVRFECVVDERGGFE